MKRKKTKSQVRISKQNKKSTVKNNISKENQKKTFFDKYISPYPDWILSGLLIFIGFMAFGKYLTLENLFFFKDIGSDSINQNYPALVHINQLFSETLIAKWSFYTGMGDTYYTAFPTQPLSWLLSPVNRLGMNMSENYLVYRRFINIFITQFIFTGILFFYYLRTLSVNKFSSLIGALTIAFSGYMVVGSAWGFAGHIFKGVFLLFAFEQLYLKKRWYFFPFAVLFLSNNPFVLFIYTIFLGIYMLFRYFSEFQNILADFLKLAGKMIMLAVVGILMNMVHVFYAFQKMFFSPRVAGNASLSSDLATGKDMITDKLLVATGFLRTFSSDLLGSGSNFRGWGNYLEAPLFYIGLLTLLIFPQVFIHLDKRKKIAFGSFFGFWVLTMIFPYLRHALLAFTGDYFRYGFDFFIPFTLLFFGIYSLNELDKNFKLNLPLLGGTFVVLLSILFFPYTSIAENAINSDMRNIIVFILVLYSGLFILMTKSAYKSFAQVGILLLLIVELSYFSYKSYEKRVAVTKSEFKRNKAGYKDGTLKAVNYIKSIDKTPFYRTEKDYKSGNSAHGSLNDALAQNYYGTTSYSSFNQLNYIRFLEETELIQKGDEIATRWVNGFRGYPLFQTFANVKYHLSKNKQPLLMRSGFDSLTVKNNITILKNRFYLPFGYTYDKYIAFKDFKTLIHYRVSEQSLLNIEQEFRNKNLLQEGNKVVTVLKSMLNIEFETREDFLTEVKKSVGEEIVSQNEMIIIKHCVDNFQNQTALLNGFVHEKNDKIEVSKLKKITLQDSNFIVPARKFSFEKYEKFVTNLRKDTFQITKFTQSEIHGKIKMTSEKMLFFTIPFDKGWKIKVNGKEKELSRVNLGFTGIVLPKGNYETELYYVPEYSVLTSWISIISIILFWGFLGYDIFRKRKKKRPLKFQLKNSNKVG